nr:MAG TPA: hypothetical protein [Caudoviricetes sp.]
MASTNKTTTLDLSQFVGTDKPDWLTDYNEDMEKIDTWATTANSNINTANNIASGAKTTAEAASQAANAATTSAAQANTAVQNILTSLNWTRGTIASPTANIFSSITMTGEYQPGTKLLNVYGTGVFQQSISSAIPSDNYISIGTLNIAGMPNPSENKTVAAACVLTGLSTNAIIATQSMIIRPDKSIVVYIADIWPTPDTVNNKRINVRFMISTNQW